MQELTDVPRRSSADAKLGTVMPEPPDQLGQSNAGDGLVARSQAGVELHGKEPLPLAQLRVERVLEAGGQARDVAERTESHSSLEARAELGLAPANVEVELGAQVPKVRLLRGLAYHSKG